MRKVLIVEPYVKFRWNHNKFANNPQTFEEPEEWWKVIKTKKSKEKEKKKKNLGYNLFDYMYAYIIGLWSNEGLGKSVLKIL